MKIVIDTDSGRLMLANPDGMRDLALYSAEGLAALIQIQRQVEQRLEAADQWGSAPFSLLGALASTKHMTIVVAQPISTNLLFYLARASQHALIVVAPQFPEDLALQLAAKSPSSKVTLIAGDITAAETLDRIRAAIPSETETLVMLRINDDPQRARQELEGSSALVSVGSYLVAAGVESTDQVPGQLEQNTAIVEFAMEHSEFRLSKSPAPGAVLEAGSVWLQRVK